MYRHTELNFLLYYFTDEDIKVRLAPYAKLVHDAENEVVGETKTSLFFEDCVFGECALGDLLVDSLVEYVRLLVDLQEIIMVLF